MNLKKNIILKLGPKFTGRIISALLSLAICFGIYHLFPKSQPQPSDGTVEAPTLPQGNGNAVSDTIDTTDDSPVVPAPSDQPIYSTENAENICSQISSASAMLCNNKTNTVLCKKAEKKELSAAPIIALTTALTVLDAVSKGTVAPGDRAVCPASAIRLPCYTASSKLLSVGQSLTVAELIKCMLCTSPELFAYTLAIHISGSEQAFLDSMKNLLTDLRATDTKITSLSDITACTTTVTDAAIIFRAATENNTLLSLLSSREAFTVSAGGSAWDIVTLCGRFYAECCTEGQAKADGIICGYYGEYNGKQFVFMLFEQFETQFITVALDSNTAYADSLILLARSVK